MGVVVALVAAMSFSGLSNLRQQWSIQGEFSNVQMEGLVDWINNSTQQSGGGGGGEGVGVGERFECVSKSMSDQ